LFVFASTEISYKFETSVHPLFYIYAVKMFAAAFSILRDIVPFRVFV